MVISLRFTDLPEKQRRRHGEAMIRSIRQTLLMPLADEHRARLEARIVEVNAIMNGPAKAPAPMLAAPTAPVQHQVSITHHEVTVTEGLSVDDTLK